MTYKQILNINGQTETEYGPEFQKHLFEQYKLYIEMADRISARRMLANSFFIGIHTALITAFCIMLKEGILMKTVIGSIPFIPVVLLSYVWWRIVYSYRQLNSGKYKVIAMIEKRLPLALYDAEWEILGKGRNPKLYRPLTHVENWVPLLFGLLYLLLVVALWCQPK
jgi:hypothetical protein